ncbi:GntR family transcriptional regulator [Anaerococcus nagyae]|uniref:GntR family transcriptional regulator n=1 Tax=Anaerococcus nagyae TaxID=1755241 RepID=A0A3E2TKN2_9FIRM|nr:GntR family transcriptional regulator [Anaerococcus nagyae]RGB77895.1 GntR family transcriptional regulator [Anaerococcus nagyae]
MNDTQSLYEKVRSEIKFNIINGKYPMGKRLKAKDLAEELYVSRTPINKALSSLYDEGLLNYNRNVGYSVRIITVDDIEEIFKIRTALDVLSFREASLNMRENDFLYMRRLLDKADLASKNGEINEIRAAAKLFNEAIYDFADMPRLTMIIANLNDYLEVLRKLSFDGRSENSRRKLSIEEHSKILDLMEAKDFNSLEEFIIKHLEGSKKYIIGESYKYKDFVLNEKEEDINEE